VATGRPDRLELSIEQHPEPTEISGLEERVFTALLTASPHPDPAELAVLLREDGVVRAGIYGWTWGGACELQHLWVDEDLRGRGLGRHLLRLAEDEAAARGCGQVLLFTHASQGAHLYPALGYELVGRVEDFPAGDAALWFKKTLAGPETEPPLAPSP
jgi:GNAT superfamily N-acetyltransferase